MNERGETRAQALATEYRASPVQPGLSPREGLVSSSSSQSFGDYSSNASEYQSGKGADLYSKRRSVASNLDAMTYIDEDYNLYRSPRSQPTDKFKGNASLVEHAATPAGVSSHRMSDLGELFHQNL